MAYIHHNWCGKTAVNMKKKMMEVGRYYLYFIAWLSFSRVCDYALVVSTPGTGLMIALAVPASGIGVLQWDHEEEAEGNGD